MKNSQSHLTVVSAILIVFFATFRIFSQPTVNSHTPTKNQHNTEVNSNIVVTFSENIKASSVNSNTFIVYGDATGFISGVYSTVGSQVTFNPDTDFKVGEKITAILTTGIQNISSTPMANDFTWQFSAKAKPAKCSFRIAIIDSTGSGDIRTAHAADIDNDGDIDVASAFHGLAKIVWYENNGSQSFTEDTIGDWVRNSKCIRVADVDGDGNLDVVSTSALDNNIILHKNDGSENFTNDTISDSANTVADIQVVDLDGDGDKDVVAVLGATEIVWYNNDGSENFTEDTISTDFGGLKCVQVVDVDSDGDFDVLSTDFSLGKVYWYENDGSENFSRHTISSNLLQPLYAHADDLDSDGDMDVLSASTMSDDSLVWYENDGSENFTQQLISTSIDYAKHFNTADIDGDGDVDVLSASSGDSTIAWHENDGSENFTKHIVSTSMDGANSVYAVDIDGDGDLDLLATSEDDGKIAWYENVYMSVTTHTPTQNQHNVSLGSNIVVTFSDTVDAATVTDSTFIISSETRGRISGSYSTSGNEVTFNLAANFRAGEKVTVALTSGLKNTSGFSLFPPYTWQFTVKSDSAKCAFTINNLTTSVDGPYGVHAADLDGDGDMDILSASYFDSKIAWYENNGSESFTAHSISTSASGAKSVYAIDMDSDGDLDVVSASAVNNTITWYKNIGLGTFTLQSSISTSANGASNVYAADLDLDGDIDVLSSSLNNDEIVWYENDGSESFTAHTVSDSADGATGVYTLDVDDDGDMDILSSSQFDDKIAWYENNGFQVFKEHSVTTSADGATSVYAADLDGDGDIDILSASSIDNKIAWYENNGSESFTAHSISTAATGATDVYAADLDGDGDLDVLSSSQQDDKIAWYENDGTANFIERSISTSADGATNVYAADIDGDGHIDVVSASLSDDSITWYDNSWLTLTSYTPTQFQQNVVKNSNVIATFNRDIGALTIDSNSFTVNGNVGGSIIGVYSIVDNQVTFNPDADIKSGELVTVTLTTDIKSSDSVPLKDNYTWQFIANCESTNGQFALNDTISSLTDAAYSVYAIDIDNDGDMDILSASHLDSKIAWYDNDGSENFIANTITTSAAGAHSVFAVDVDNDGDVDVLSASQTDDKIVWYENDGSENFSDHTISTTADGAICVFAMDVDSDGDIDVLSASPNDDKIAWYENDGSENFTEDTISLSADGATSVYAVDIDGDGDVDVISSSQVDNKIAWYENNGMESFTSQIISSSANGASSVFATDVDTDGDMDVLSASSADNTIAWYENDGSENFTEHPISTSANGALCVYAADLNGDGNVDVLSSSFSDDKVAWYRNDGSENFTEDTITLLTDYPAYVYAADVDSDGDLDVLSASVTEDKIEWFENDPYYSLTYTAGTNGTLSGTTSQNVLYGTNGTPVTAIPNSGYYFVDWSDASTDNPRTDLNVTSDISVTANFSINVYILTYMAGLNGIISGTTPQNVSHGGSGTAVTAVPNPGYHFVNWSDGITDNPRTDASVTANFTVTANFAINVYTLTYVAGLNGTINGTTPQNVNHGGSGTAVTAVPDPGYHFVNWSDGITDNPRTDASVTTNLTVTANFSINVYTLTYTAGLNGAISGTTPQSVSHGGNGTAVTAVPNPGYHFVNWSDGVTDNPRTDVSVTANLTVTANFSINVYTLTYTAGLNGAISGTTPQSVSHGGNGTAVTAVPNPGYHFVNWSDGVMDNPRTDLNVTADISVTANFDLTTDMNTHYSQNKPKVISAVHPFPNPVDLQQGYIDIFVTTGLSLPEVRLVIFDALGNLVNEQTNGFSSRGTFQFRWDLRNNDNLRVAPGTYKVIAFLFYKDGSIRKSTSLIGVKK